MPRTRTTRPRFWESKCLGRLSVLARLTFLGMKDQADDEGRGLGDIESIFATCHRYAHPNVKRTLRRALVELGAGQGKDGPEILRDLESPRRSRGFSTPPREVPEGGPKVPESAPKVPENIKLAQGCPTCGSSHVVFYKVDGRIYYCLPGFKKHQTMNRVIPSTIPPQSFHNFNGTENPANTTTTTTVVVKKEEGTPIPETVLPTPPPVVAKTEGTTGDAGGNVVVVSEKSKEGKAQELLSRINPGRSEKLLSSVGLVPRVAQILSACHPVGTVFLAVEGSKRAKDRAGWTRRALEGGWTLPPADPAELERFLKVLEGDIGRSASLMKSGFTQLGIPFPPGPPGETAEEAIVRKNRIMKERKLQGLGIAGKEPVAGIEILGPPPAKVARPG